MRETTLEVDGLRIFAREAGEGEPILFLHGIPATSLLWKDHVDRLGAFGRAIAIDLPGYGRSDKPADASYSAAWYLTFLERLVDTLGAERVSILCHDVGGFPALAYAAEHPERIRRLVVFNTSIYPEFRPPGRVRILRSPLLAWTLRAAAPPRPIFRALIAGGFANRAALTREVLTEFRSSLRERAGREAQLRWFRSVDSAAMRERYREWSAKLGALRAPTLVIWGARDHWITLADNGRRIAGDIPGARLIELDAKHFVPLDAAAVVGRHLEEFFQAPA